MRKVFLWNIILGKADNQTFVSNDYDIEGMSYKFLMSYIIDANTNENENIAVITSYTIGGSAESNYKDFSSEVNVIAKKKKLIVKFIPLVQDVEFASGTFNKFFKNVVAQLKDNDLIYADITFGMKPYTLGMFTALNYIAKVSNNVRVEQISYAQKYNGAIDTDKVEKSVLYDLTTLFYLNKVTGNLSQGDRVSADKMLELLLK